MRNNRKMIGAGRGMDARGWGWHGDWETGLMTCTKQLVLDMKAQLHGNGAERSNRRTVYTVTNHPPLACDGLAGLDGIQNQRFIASDAGMYALSNRRRRRCSSLLLSTSIIALRFNPGHVSMHINGSDLECLIFNAKQQQQQQHG